MCKEQSLTNYYLRVILNPEFLSSMRYRQVISNAINECGVPLTIHSSSGLQRPHTGSQYYKQQIKKKKTLQIHRF